MRWTRGGTCLAVDPLRAIGGDQRAAVVAHRRREVAERLVDRPDDEIDETDLARGDLVRTRMSRSQTEG